MPLPVHAGVVTVHDGGVGRETDPGQPILRVVLIRDRHTLRVGLTDHVPRRIIAVSCRTCIRRDGLVDSTFVVILVLRRVAVRVGHAREIRIGVVAIVRRCVQRLKRGGETVQGIVGIRRRVPLRVLCRLPVPESVIWVLLFPSA